MFKIRTHTIVLMFIALTVTMWSVFFNLQPEEMLYSASIEVSESGYRWSLDKVGPYIRVSYDQTVHRIEEGELQFTFQNNAARSLDIQMGNKDSGPAIQYKDPDQPIFQDVNQGVSPKQITIHHEARPENPSLLSRLVSKRAYEMNVVDSDQVIYQSRDQRITDTYQFDGNRTLKHTTIYHFGDGAEEEVYTFENTVLHLREDGVIEGYYLENIDLSNEEGTEGVDNNLLARASRFLAKERLNDLHEHGGPNPDFTIPAPFALDKNNNELFVFYEIKGDSFNQLKLNFYADPDSYPLVLDPTLEFTVPGATTSSDVITGQSSNTRFGSVLAGDLDDDGDLDLVVGAAEYSTWQGRVYIFYNDGSYDTAAGNADVIITGETSPAADSRFGDSLVIGDLDNDGGIDDLAIGSPFYNSQQGRVYVFYSTSFESGGSCETSCNATSADVTLTGPTGSRFGINLAVGDLDDDNDTDLIVGASSYDVPATDSGRAYIYLNNSGIPGTASVEIAGALLGEFGFDIDVGDFNGDNRDDLVMAAHWDNAATGTVYIFFSEGSGFLACGTSCVAASEADVTFNGESALEGRFGWALSVADLNADGYNDVAIGAWGYNTSDFTGRVYVFYGNGDGTFGSGSCTTCSASTSTHVGETITGESTGVRFGFSVTTGDLNNDTKTDLIIGSREYSGVGRTYVYYNDGSYPSAAGDADVIITGEGKLGGSVAVGDLNNDNFNDLIIGDRGFDPGSAAWTGRAYIFYGGGALVHQNTIAGEATGNYFSGALATGDLDNDGDTDLAVGAWRYNSSQGRVYIFYNDGSYATAASSADVIIAGSAGDRFGNALATGDLDNDGDTDLAVGAEESSDYKGRAYVFYNDTTSGFGTVSCTTGCLAANADVIITGEAADDELGNSLATGDLNDDGRTDLVVGANVYPAGDYTGRVYVYYNEGSGTFLSCGTGCIANTAADVIIDGENISDEFGDSLAIGDLNGDNKDDLAAGAFMYPAFGGQGRAYIFYSVGSGTFLSCGTSCTAASNANVIIDGETSPAADSQFSASLVIGDLDGDNDDDLVVGADGYSTRTGRAYVFYNDGTNNFGTTTCSGTPASCSAANADETFTGEATYDDFGASLAAFDSDVDGDMDLAVGANAYDVGSNTNEGRVYIFYNDGSYPSATNADMTITGEAGIYFGNNLTSGDLDNDNDIDLVIGSENYNTNQGRVYIYYNTTPFCGDGIVMSGEACDDGNTTGSDGCSATCTIESGYGCVGEPSSCQLNEGVSTSSSITNLSPVLSATPSDGWSSSATPTDVGDNVTFTATATDANSDQYFLAVCKTDAVTAGAGGSLPNPPTCASVPNTWAISTAINADSQASVNYAALSGDAESNAWYAFVCDNLISSDSPACYPASAAGDQGSALGTVTFTGLPADGDNITVDSIIYEFDIGGSFTNIQVNISASVFGSDVAAALVAAEVGTSSSMVNRGGVVTVRADTKGATGNSIAMTENLDTNTVIALSGGTLTGGSDDNASPFYVNHAPTFENVVVSDQTVSPTQLLTNGNMETGNPPSNWFIPGDATATSEVDERTGGSGTQSMEVTRGATNWWVASQDFSTTIGKTYRVSGWIKNVDADRATLLVSNSDFSVVQESSIITSTSWTYTTFDFVAEDTTSKIHLSIGNDSGDTARLDDVSIYEVGTIEPGESLRFTLPQEQIADADTSGAQDIIVMHICTSATTSFNYSTNTCTGGSLICSTLSWGTAELIETDNSGNAGYPEIAIDSAGNAISVWRQRDGTRYNIWANRYTFSTGLWGTAELIETDNSGNAGYPQIASGSSGNMIAVWHQSDGTRDNIWANRYTFSTGLWGTAELIETDNSGNADFPEIAIDSAGNAISVWRQWDGTRYNIWSNRYTFSTGLWGTAEMIETDNSGDAINEQIAIDGSDNAIAVWSQSDGTRYNIWSNRYTFSTGLWGTAEMIETDNSGNALNEQIAIDGSGNAIVVWQQQDSSPYNIWANRYTNGVGWGIAEMIESDSGTASEPHIAMYNSGDAIVVWQQNDGTRYNIYSNFYTSGSGWSAAELVETNNVGSAYNPRIASDNSGNMVAVWQQWNGVHNIWANRYTSGSGWGIAEMIETENLGTAIGPQIAIDSFGNAISVWYQDDGTLDNINANRLIIGVDPTFQDATCDETGNALVPIPTAHTTTAPFKVYVKDHHNFPATGTNSQTYTVQDVAPTWVSYTSPSSPITLTTGTTTAVNFSTVVADDNGDNDITAIAGVFWDDSASGGALENNCATDNNDCYLASYNAIGLPDNTCTFDIAITGDTAATGADTNRTANCLVQVYYNANPSGNWEVHVNPTDGNGLETGLADSNDNTAINEILAINIVTPNTINYGSLAPGATSTGQTTSVGNSGNVVIDVTVQGTDMTCTDTAACIADPIDKAQQKWTQTDGVSFDWATQGHALITSAGAGDADTNGCANVGLLVRNDGSSTTEFNENLYWKLQIPLPQAQGSYTGENTLASIADISCTGTP